MIFATNKFMKELSRLLDEQLRLVSALRRSKKSKKERSKKSKRRRSRSGSRDRSSRRR